MIADARERSRFWALSSSRARDLALMNLHWVSLPPKQMDLITSTVGKCLRDVNALTAPKS